MVAYNGVYYPSLKVLSKDVGIPLSVLKNRMKRGYSLKDAIQKGNVWDLPILVFGKTYDNLKDVSNAYKLNYNRLVLKTDELDNTELAVQSLQEKEK